MKFIRTAKGRSSRLLRQEFAHLRTRLPTLWTNSCFISSVGGAPLEVIKQYIANQQNSERPKQKNKWRDYVNRLQAEAFAAQAKISTSANFYDSMAFAITIVSLCISGIIGF